MAGSSVIGALRVTLGLDTAQFTTNAKQAESRAEQLGLKIGKSMRSAAGEVSAFTKAFVGLGVVAGATALGDLASKGLEYASSLGEVAQQLGVTTKDLQEYRYAATQVGISQEEMDKGLAKLTLTMGQAREGVAKPVKAFKELSDLLGKDVLKNAATAGDAIPLISDALAKVQDPAKRAAIEVALFGKTGQKLDTLLAGGSSAIDGLRDAAQRMGRVLSEKEIQDADAAADKLADLKTVLEANIAGAVASNANAILDFVNAIERLIAKIPSAINEIGKFRDYLNIGQGVAQSAIGALTLNAGKARSGAEITAAARQDLEIRKNAGKPFFGDAARQSVAKYISANVNTKSAGAGASGSGGSARRGASGAARDRERAAEKALRDERRYQQDLSRAQDEQLSAQLDITVDQAERANIQQALLDNDLAGKIEAIQTDKDLSAEQKKKLIAIATDTNTLQAIAAHRQDQEIVARAALDAVSASNDNQQDVLNAQADLARTAKERGAIELKILDLQFEQLRLVQQAIIDSKTSTAQEKELARQRLGVLGTLQGYATAKSQRDNAGPLAQYLDSLPRSANEVNDALQAVQADGLKGLIDGIATAKGDFKSLADVVNNVANDIIASLLRIGLQRGIAALFGSLLGGTRGLAASVSAGSSHALDFLTAGNPITGARAGGGSVIGGKSYLVGERGPEIFTAPHTGNIVANDNMGGGGRVSVYQTITYSGAVDIADKAYVNQMASLTKTATMQALQEQQKRR